MLKITIADENEPVFSLCGEPWTPPPPKSVDERLRDCSMRFWNCSMPLEAKVRNNDCTHEAIKQESWLKKAMDWCLTPPEHDDGV